MKTGKNVIKNLIKALLLLIAGIALGYILLLLVYLLPTKTMRNNISQSVNVFDNEREYHRVIPGYISTQLDNYTDSWMVGNAIFDNDSQSIWEKALSCTRAEYGEGPLDALVKYSSGEAGYTTESYARYWHGYLVLLKPLFLVFNYADLRVINIILETLLVALVFLSLNKREYGMEAFGYLISVLFIMPVVVPLSIQFSIVFYIANIGALVLIVKYKIIEERGFMFLYFQILGMVTSYCDLLTYPIASLGLPLVCLMLLKGRTDNPKEVFSRLKYIILAAISWGFGYGAMWLGKWVLSTVVLGDNVIANAFSQILMRSSHIQEGEKIDTLHTWLRNVEFYFEKPYMAVILVSVVIAVLLLVKNLKNFKNIFWNVIPFIVIAFMPFAWYMFAGQHSYEHHWFTFRGTMVSVFALLCAVICVYRCGNKVDNGDKQ